jgi:hypothetical protein
MKNFTDTAQTGFKSPILEELYRIRDEHSALYADVATLAANIMQEQSSATPATIVHLPLCRFGSSERMSDRDAQESKNEHNENNGTFADAQ